MELTFVSRLSIVYASYSLNKMGILRAKMLFNLHLIYRVKVSSEIKVYKMINFGFNV